MRFLSAILMTMILMVSVSSAQVFCQQTVPSTGPIVVPIGTPVPHQQLVPVPQLVPVRSTHTPSVLAPSTQPRSVLVQRNAAESVRKLDEMQKRLDQMIADMKAAQARRDAASARLQQIEHQTQEAERQRQQQAALVQAARNTQQAIAQAEIDSTRRSNIVEPPAPVLQRQQLNIQQPVNTRLPSKEELEAAKIYPIQFEQMWREHRGPKWSSESRFMYRILTDRRTIYYKLPKLWQYKYRDLYAVLPIDVDSKFNANKDFPWPATVGLEEAPEGWYKTVNFLHLPVGKPVAIIDTERPIKWIFPEGTTAGEIIFVRHPRTGQWWTQEVRTRTKDADVWEPGVFRPIRNLAEFYTALTELEPNTARLYNRSQRHFHIRNIEEDFVMKLEGHVERMENIDQRTVETLLDLPFKDVTLDKWSDVSDSPMADQPFHILPQNYTFGTLKVDAQSCANCHRQTGIKTNHLTPNEPIIKFNPSRVGRIRGGDGIFTWHPFHSSVVKHSITDRPEDLRVVYRKFDVDNRIIEAYDPAIHTEDEGYYMTPYVVNSLQDDELPVFLRTQTEMRNPDEPVRFHQLDRRPLSGVSQ